MDEPDHTTFKNLDELLEYVKKEARRRIREGEISFYFKEDEPN